MRGVEDQPKRLFDFMAGFRIFKFMFRIQSVRTVCLGLTSSTSEAQRGS